MTNAGQIVLKKEFVDFWTRAVQTVPAEDVMVVDAGDGAALTSLVEPEDTLRVAMKLYKLLEDEGDQLPQPLKMRMGINFGPVQLSVDVHGKPCIVGDAINSASRVMSFAQGGQIAISRSYYDAILPLSDKYAEMFQHLGKRADKHGRQHELYVYGKPGSITPSGDEDEKAPVKPVSANVVTPVAPKVPSGASRMAKKAARLPGQMVGAVFGVIRKIIALSIVSVVIYELMVLVPLMDTPGAIQKEVGQQVDSLKLFAVGEWQAAMADREGLQETAAPAEPAKKKK